MSRALVVEGLELVAARRVAEAERVLDTVLAASLEPGLLPFASTLAWSVGRFHDAVLLLEDAARRLEGPRRAAALRVLLHQAAQLGWQQEAAQALGQLRALGPIPDEDRRELRRLMQARDVEAARALAQALLASTDDLSLRLELCNALALAADLPALKRELDRVSPEREEEFLEKVRLLVDADACAEAEALALEGARRFEACAGLHVWASRLATWRADASTGEARARRAVACDAGSADAWCALGAALEQRERRSGRDAFAKACELDPAHAEALTWCADLAELEGDDEAMTRYLNRAVSVSAGHPVATWLLRAHGALPSAMPVNELSEARVQESATALEELVPGAVERWRSAPTVDFARETLRRARVALSGNYGVHATRWDGVRLTRLGPAARTGPRNDSRRALELVRTRPLAEVCRAFAPLESRWSRSSLPDAHHAELHLWAGELDEAERLFRRAMALTRGTRFAWIGLTGVELLRGQLTQALETCAEGVMVMRDTSGPAVFVYRGEVLRKLGRLDEAVSDFEAALTHTPRRLSATMNLALALHARGDAARAEAAWRHVADHAPALVSDARRVCPAGAAWPVVMEKALESMRGNRSTSLITYFVGERLRLVPNAPGAAAFVQRRTAREVASALATLKRVRA